MNINDSLNKADVHKNKSCARCGRQYPKTVLNIEGAIHHRGPIECIDRKSCKRATRKKK